MNFYNIKSALKDNFYGVPRVIYGTRQQDACALASMSSGMEYLRASNGRHYWYFFIQDIKDRDLIRWFLRRNGLNVEYHVSHVHGEHTPAFRVRMLELNQYQDLADFVRSIDSAYHNENIVKEATARYIDTIQTKIQQSKLKSK